MDARIRRTPAGSSMVTWTEEVAAAGRLNTPRLTTTTATTRACTPGGGLPAVLRTSAVVVRQGSGMPPAPGGGSVNSRRAATIPVLTLMNCNSMSTLAVPTLAAHKVNCCPASTGSGGLASRHATTTLAQAGDPAIASKAIQQASRSTFTSLANARRTRLTSGCVSNGQIEWLSLKICESVPDVIEIGRWHAGETSVVSRARVDSV